MLVKRVGNPKYRYGGTSVTVKRYKYRYGGRGIFQSIGRKLTTDSVKTLIKNASKQLSQKTLDKTIESVGNTVGNTVTNQVEKAIKKTYNNNNNKKNKSQKKKASRKKEFTDIVKIITQGLEEQQSQQPSSIEGVLSGNGIVYD